MRKITFIFIVLIAQVSGSSELENQAIQAYESGDTTTAIKLFKEMSRSGNGESSYHVGTFYWEGRGVQRNVLQAEKYLRISCQQGYKEGCFEIGNLYQNSKEYGGDFPRALRFYEKGCKLRGMRSCNAAGVLYNEGGGGVVANKRKASRRFQIAVDEGSRIAKENLKSLCIETPGACRK